MPTRRLDHQLRDCTILSACGAAQGKGAEKAAGTHRPQKSRTGATDLDGAVIRPANAATMAELEPSSSSEMVKTKGMPYLTLAVERQGSHP